MSNEFMVTEVFSEVNVTLYTSRYTDVFAGLKHWAITWDRIRIVKLYSFFFSLFCAETGIKLEEMISSRLLNCGAAAVCHSRLNSAKTAFNVWILKYNG